MKLFGLILTFNCERFVEKTLKYSYNKFDKIICSDDGSADETKQKFVNKNIEFFHEHLGYGGNFFSD